MNKEQLLEKIIREIYGGKARTVTMPSGEIHIFPILEEDDNNTQKGGNA